MTAQFVGSNTVVQGLDTDASRVAETRALLTSKGYGRASAAVFDGRYLPYAENIANLAIGEAGDVSVDDILWILRPRQHQLGCLRGYAGPTRGETGGGPHDRRQEGD